MFHKSWEFVANEKDMGSETYIYKSIKLQNNQKVLSWWIFIQPLKCYSQLSHKKVIVKARTCPESSILAEEGRESLLVFDTNKRMIQVNLHK